jgi:hypothetical protein
MTDLLVYYPPPIDRGILFWRCPSVRPSVCHPNFVSRLVLCNYWLKFNETLWESSISRGDAHIIALFQSNLLTQSYGSWLLMQYAYRAIIVSVLLLSNYWLESQETLFKLSIPRGNVHIVALFRSLHRHFNSELWSFIT